MKGRKASFVILTLLCAFLFGGTAEADPLDDWGYLEIENQLNSRSIRVIITRDTEFIPEATDGFESPPDVPANSQPPIYPNLYSDINTNNLWSDYRLNNSNAPYNIMLSFNGSLPSTQSNLLKFVKGDASINYGGFFGNKSIIYESDRLPYGHVVDIRRAMALAPDPNEVEIPLEDVPAGTYNQWSPYGSGILTIGTRKLANLNDIGPVDLEDFLLLAQDWGKTAGQYAGDITGPFGIPDGEVDICDLEEFVSEWLE